MPKELKTLLKKNPNLLRSVPEFDREIRHFIFSVVDGSDPIALPLCGAVDGINKHKLHGVTCPQCLTALEEYAIADTYSAALAKATQRIPRIIEPDTEVMKETHAGQPTREAVRHLKASAFLKSKCCVNASDLPKRSIGAQPSTLYKNLYELGLIDIEGERTGVKIADLVAGEIIEHESDIEITETE